MKNLIVKFLLFLLITSLTISQIVIVRSGNDSLSNYDSLKPSFSRNKSVEITQANNYSGIPEILHVADQLSPGILGLDPHLDLHPRLISLCFEGLVDVELDTGAIIPGLAYQWVVTNDSKEWTFYLRDDVKFHDGSKFNASDVKFSFERIFNSSHPLYADRSWVPIDSAIPFNSLEIVNEFEIKLIFSEPYAPLIQRLPIVTIISPKSFQGLNFTYPIGTGPYKLDLNSTIISFNETFYNFTSFSNYYGGSVPFKGIEYESYFGRYEELQNAISTKEVDMIITRDENLISDILISDLLEPVPYWEVTSLNGLALHDLGWFNHRSTIFSDVNVRKAINHAIDKNAYIDEVRGGIGELINSIIPPNIPYHNPEIPGYEYDLSEANRLLDEAGYFIDENNIRFTLTMVSPNFAIDRAQFVCSSLEEINIYCDFQTDEGDFSRWFAGDYDIYIVGYQHIFDPSIAYDLLNSEGSNNYGGYSNSVTDVLTKLAIQTPVRQEQEFYYNLVQTIAQEESPYILLADLPFPYVRTKNITSLVGIDNYFQIDFYDLEENNFFNELNSLNLDISAKLLKSQYESSDVNTIENVVLGEKPLYFPFTDSMLFSQNQDLKATVKMTSLLQNLLDTEEDVGKFYEVIVDQPNYSYSFRAYYDLHEVQSISHDKLSLFKWDSSEKSWIEMSSAASNASLRYIEVNIIGNAYLKFGEKPEMNNSFYVPIISFSALFLMVGVASFAFWAIRKNIKFFKGLKDRYGL